LTLRCGETAIVHVPDACGRPSHSKKIVVGSEPTAIPLTRRLNRQNLLNDESNASRGDFGGA
tara:strand:+ start:2370 stop:2555 length:186 start_codon:yes stop_codon:yes gene_type:complete